MTPDARTADSRREFLTGRSAARAAESALAEAGGALLDTLGRPVPEAGPTVRLETRAMACQWQVVLNPGPASQVMHASDALDLVQQLEDLLTVYRPDGHLAVLNAAAGEGPQAVEPLLLEALSRSLRLAKETGGAFDPTFGPLVAVWRACREEGRVPDDAEIEEARSRCGLDRVRVDEDAGTVELEAGTELNLGAFGKGFALEKAAEFLAEQGVANFLIHGGASSVTARGVHVYDGGRVGGWPVGVRNPLVNRRRMMTLLLGDADEASARSMGTSGGNVQYFRVGGRRYGHILDPRTGRPAEGLLSATVLTADAGAADALSTACFVAGLETARDWCKDATLTAVLTPPAASRDVAPVLCGLPEDAVFRHDAEAAPA